MQQANTSDHLQKIFSTSFKIPLEQIFYEDVSQIFNSPFDKKDFDTVANDLEKLVQFLTPITFNTQKETLLAFYKSKFKGKNIDLLDFYEVLFQNKEIDLQAARNLISKKRASFIQALKEKGTWLNQDHFHLNWVDFPTYEVGNYKIDKSKASLVQLYQKEGKIKAFSDSIFMGYGKMFGRFLNLFPSLIEEKIRSKNTALSEGDLWMELTDASIYNPNVHPALVPLEIQMPGSQNNLKQASQIPIDQLEIVFYKNENRLALFHKEDKKEVTTFNFGFEALENRSPMYRLLSSFAFQSVSPDLLTRLLNEFLKKEDDLKIIHKPRISVGDHLVIQRKSWGIPKSLIPIKENAQEDFSYFHEINKWRKDLAIPGKVFISINPVEYRSDSGRIKGDDYKPQYIDFESPLLVQLFSKLINKIPTYLKIEEMLPEMESENDYVQEYLLEWEV